MDFALGPNQGQGVPAEYNDEGLQWDLVFILLRMMHRPDMSANCQQLGSVFCCRSCQLFILWCCVGMGLW